MSKIFKRAVSSALALALAASLVTACGSSQKAAEATASPAKVSTASEDSQGEKSLEPITLTFFDKNTGDPFGNDDVSKEIIKRTGVSLEMQQPTGNANEKLNLLLASGDLPDIILMDRSGDITNKYISTKSFIPLNDLIDKYGPDVKSMYGNILNQTRSEDGQNYYLSNWYGFEEEPVFGFMMRKDVLAQVAPDVAAGGKPITTDEYIDILKKVKEKNPKINGHETIPVTMWTENWTAQIGTLKGAWGMKTFYDDGSGTLRYEFKDPQFVEIIKFWNRLYTEGLLEREWAVNKKQLWLQKCSGGYVFSTLGAYWDLGEANTVLKKESDDSQFYPYKVTAPGVDAARTTYGPRSGLGWDAIGISKSNKNPERTMQFINFLASEEGQYLLQWGVQDKTWNIENGKHVPLPGVLDNFNKDWNKYRDETGIRKWTWFIKNGPGSDGTPYDLAARYNRNDLDNMALKNLSDSTWDSAPFDGLNPAGGTAEALVYQKIDDLYKQAIPKCVYAKTEGEAVNLFNKFVADANTAGAEKVEKVITDNYNKRMELWK